MARYFAAHWQTHRDARPLDIPIIHVAICDDSPPPDADTGLEADPDIEAEGFVGLSEAVRWLESRGCSRVEAERLVLSDPYEIRLRQSTGGSPTAAQESFDRVMDTPGF